MGDKMENLIKNYKQVQEKLKKIVSLEKVKKKSQLDIQLLDFQ